MNTESLLGSRREIDTEVNTEKTIYIVMSRHHNAGQNHNLLVTNKSSENVEKFQYFGTTITNLNCIH
jgi:hypothetical protein